MRTDTCYPYRTSLAPFSKLHPPGGESLLDPTVEAPGGLPPVVTLCGKMDLLDRLLVRLHATKHKVSGGVEGGWQWCDFIWWQVVAQEKL